ncbi:hypothetical protein D910_09244 [Dendroctonus ponderosae]|uniref:Ras-associating domain-containing protein n=1 Tax=Dendroctonus ponderosae TaxID=77166 RepID=U4UP46_DENPD|nr:hypothetical protein D910_09244 [Dendroctonus ponderosae]
MELKVWVEGIQRIVCGVTENTTCQQPVVSRFTLDLLFQDVVFALAHATGKSGRFTLIERWRNNERQLAPHENPMKILLKWGEYSNDVQFILQRSDSSKPPNKPKPHNSVAQPPYTDILKDSQSRAFETSHKVAPSYKDPPAPPPYRDPPPPSSNVNNDKFKKNIFPFDAEIVFWESKEREKQLQLDFIAQEMANISSQTKNNKDQDLAYVEDESEIVKQQEKTLKSEITLLRSKLANCETELLQCKNKIRLLMDELQLEQRMSSKKHETRKQVERSILMELERIQKDIELAKQSTDMHHLTAEDLKKEVAQLEVCIIEKKKQVEQLVQEMKEANLQSLSIAPPEDIRQILEGPTKGTTRKMIGSPRQLENAVPTSKNPHGVWV